MDRFWRTAGITVLVVFVGYAIVTRPAVAADAVHAVWRGIVSGADAVVTFLDTLIPKQ